MAYSLLNILSSARSRKVEFHWSRRVCGFSGHANESQNHRNEGQLGLLRRAEEERTGIVTFLVVSHKWSWMNNLHCVLWTLGISTGFHTFSPVYFLFHTAFLPHTHIYFIELVMMWCEMCDKVNKILFYLNSAWLWPLLEFYFHYLKIHTFHTQWTTECHLEISEKNNFLISHDLTVGMSTCKVTERVTGSSMQDPDLVGKFSHQRDQPLPSEHNETQLEVLGHVQLPQASKQWKVLHMGPSYQIISSSKNLSFMFLLTKGNCIYLQGLTCTDTFAMRQGGGPFRSTTTNW